MRMLPLLILATLLSPVLVILVVLAAPLLIPLAIVGIPLGLFALFIITLINAVTSGARGVDTRR